MKRNMMKAKLPAPWWTNYWLSSLAAIAAAEAAFAIWFMHQRAVHDRDLADGCPDECLGTWLEMLFVGFLLFAWPIVALVLAVLGRISFSGYRALRRRHSASRD